MEKNIATEMAMWSDLTATNGDLKKILDDWQSHKPIDLNIFRLVSDTYHRECFHSDVIKRLLEPKTHPDSILLFIKLLNDLRPELLLKPKDYADAEILREVGNIDNRIDIRIQPPNSKHCIIVENKINDAIDQHEQLSRYFTKLNPEVIVYLSKDGTKQPSEYAFKKSNRTDLEKRLVNVAAYANEPGKDLVTGWLYPLLKVSDNDGNLTHLIQQYIDILTEIGKHMINIDAENEFLEWLSNDSGNNFKYAKLVTELFNRRIEFALRRIVGKYEDEGQKRRYKIIRLATTGPQSGRAFAQIQVETKCHDKVQIWMEGNNGKIGLVVHKIIGERKESMYKLLADAQIDIPRPEPNELSTFQWPGQEPQLSNTIDSILDFLQRPLPIDIDPQRSQQTNVQP